MGPIGYGNSPYQSLSSFAGNSLLISPGSLISDGILKKCDCDAPIPFKQRLIEKAWTKFKSGEREDLRLENQEFLASQKNWLEDDTLFRALRGETAPTQVVEAKPARSRRNFEPQNSILLRHEPSVVHRGLIVVGSFAGDLWQFHLLLRNALVRNDTQ